MSRSTSTSLRQHRYLILVVKDPIRDGKRRSHRQNVLISFVRLSRSETNIGGSFEFGNALTNVILYPRGHK